ncbi:hypothetical protein [Tissierella sp.]|uniref:hypothetical protein n=1 Tax=Tissierella sp. TaxID=41274 RepID=UPI00302CC470
MLIIKNIILILIIAYLLWVSEDHGGDAPGMYYVIIAILVYIITKPIFIKLGMLC